MDGFWIMAKLATCVFSVCISLGVLLCVLKSGFQKQGHEDHTLMLSSSMRKALPNESSTTTVCGPKP